MTNQLIEHKDNISTNGVSSPTFKPDFPPLPAVFSYLQFTVPVHQFCKSTLGFLLSYDPTTNHWWRNQQWLSWNQNLLPKKIVMTFQVRLPFHVRLGQAGANCLNFFREKDLGNLVSTKCTMNQQWALTAKSASGILGCIRQSTAKGSGKVILCSALLRHTWNTQFSSGLPSAREMNVLEWVQQRAMKVIRVLKHWHTYEERLSGWELFSLDTRPREIIGVFINI